MHVVYYLFAILLTILAFGGLILDDWDAAGTFAFGALIVTGFGYLFYLLTVIIDRLDKVAAKDGGVGGSVFHYVHRWVTSNT